MTGIDYTNIDLLVLDVDGVLTDGRVTLDEDGREIKTFHVRDGSGMKYWQRVGRKLALISGRGSPAITARAAELGVECVRLNAKDKLPVLKEVLNELGIAPERTAVVGDDLPDLPLLRYCGVGIATADAVEEVRKQAVYVTTLPGGAGCVREVIEMILRGSGDWERIMERYIPKGEEEQA